MRSLNRRIVLGSVSGLAATLVLATGLGAFVRSGAAASAVAPHNTAPPTISGTPREGHPLDGNRGQWSGNPTSFVYSWYRCKTVCSVIGGADEQRYVLT